MPAAAARLAPLAPPALADGLARRRFTVADVIRMVEVGLIDERERLEILDGEIVPMSPKGYRHEGLKGALNRHWGRTCPDGFDYLQETGLYLSDHTYLEPDFICFRADTDLRTLRGPDVLLAIEVADSSLRYDLNRKPPIYAAHGVHELWVIDAPERRIHLFRNGDGARFAETAVVAADARVEPHHAPAALGFSLDDLRRPTG